MSLRTKMSEYKILASINSYTECPEVISSPNILETSEPTLDIENLLYKVDILNSKLSSISHQNFLRPSWQESFESIRFKIQTGNYSVDDLKLSLAALIFNASISVSSEQTDNRIMLLELFDDIVMKL